MKNLLSKMKVAAIAGALSISSTHAQSSIFDIVKNSPDHTILEAALIQQGLDSTLSNPNINYTLFAPNDSAFNAYLSNTGQTAGQLLGNPELTNILLHHVLGTKVISDSLSNSEVKTLNGKDVTINIDNGAKIDSANVITANIDDTNGVVHSIGYVLLPTYDDVTEIVVGSPNHTTLLAALQKANLVSTLQDLSKEYTVLAPTDSAFNKYFSNSGTTANDLLNSSDLTNILLHHVLGSKALSTGLSNSEVNTLNGKDITINVDNGVKIDSSNVTAADLSADNGVVHVIDYVLLPTYDDVTEIVVGSPNHTTLLAALQKANLVGTLQDLSKEYTVFAPTDSAFNMYLTAKNLTAQELLDSPDLTKILLNHVLGSRALSSGLTDGNVTTLNSTTVAISVGSGVKVDTANVTAADLIAGNGVVHVIDAVLEINTTTGIKNININEVKLFPVPALSNLNVQGIENGELVQIYNQSGKLIKQTTLTLNSLDVSDLPAGNYILRSEYYNGSSFIKQ